jgi:membrane dipeptidase
VSSGSISASAIHDSAIVIDATCPLLKDEYLEWWIEGGVTAAAPSVGGVEPAGQALKNLGHWLRRIEQDDRLTLIRSARDIEVAKEAGKFGIIFHFQGTEPIENDLNLVDAYKALGVGIIQLAYNVKNRVGDGCEERTDCGLSNFGVALIKRMNQAKVKEEVENSASPVGRAIKIEADNVTALICKSTVGKRDVSSIIGVKSWT